MVLAPSYAACMVAASIISAASLIGRILIILGPGDVASQRQVKRRDGGQSKQGPTGRWSNRYDLMATDELS